MKINKLYLILLILSLCLGSCEDDLSDNHFQVRIEEDFQTGEENENKNFDLKFTIVEIVDSRCPRNVQCVWEGQAIVKIVIESPQEASIELNTLDNPSDTIGSFVFNLIDVSPYPDSTDPIPQEDYDITLKIENL